MANKTNIEWRWRIAAKRIGISEQEYLDMIALGQKWCTSCKCWHPRSIFQIDKSRSDGLTASCRFKGYRLPMTSEARRVRSNYNYRSMYHANPNIRLRIMARNRGIEPIDALAKEWIFERFEGQCAYCDQPATTVDHIIPIKCGGGSQRGNILPACRSCNSKKRTKPLEQFYSECLARGSNIKIDEIIDEIVMGEIL